MKRRICIFFARKEDHLEKSHGEVMVYGEHFTFGAVKNVGKKLGVNALLPT